eukprot:15360918-Ditylum_brightwellii.AAC.1
MLATLPDENGTVHYFLWKRGNYEKLTATARWDKYMPYFEHKTTVDPTVRFLNQLNGQQPSKMVLMEDVVNEQDSRIQCSVSGPDLLILSHVQIPYKSYFSCIPKKEMASSVTDSLPRLMVKKRECSKKRKQESRISTCQ